MPRKKNDKTKSNAKTDKVRRPSIGTRVVPRPAGKTAGKRALTVETPPGKHAAAPGSSSNTDSTMTRKKVTRHTFKSDVLEKAGRSWELPTRYGETKAVLLARDPYWIYAYWEITSDQQDSSKAFLGAEYSSSSTVLRVFQSPGPGGGEPLFLYDVEVRPYITNWYLNVHHPDQNYFIEIVQRSPTGRVYTLARSNTVTTPRDFATPSPEKKWRVPDSLAKYFRRENETQQTGISSAEVAEGFPPGRYPSGKGL